FCGARLAHQRAPGSPQSPLHAGRQAARLRQPLSQRRGRALPARQRGHRGKRRRCAFDYSFHCRRKLKAARVLCIGAGGLGSPLAFYLAAAGIGTLGMVDFDVVDSSNLQRQIIHSTREVGRKKLDSAAEKLTALNPALNVVKHETMLTSANALEILKDYDIVA